MGVKNIHVLLIAVSIILCAGFGLWALKHGSLAWGIASFVTAIGLIIYLIQFVKKMKAL